MQRYPVYLKALRKLKAQGISRVMSHELSELVGFESTTIRRDFYFLWALGRQGYGYDVEYLIEVFNQELGMVLDEKIILIGAGNLGRALMKYNRWHHVVGEIACAFDISEDRLGVRFDIPVYHLNEIEEKKPEGCKVAIIAASTGVQETIDRLVACGVVGFIDITHEHIRVPKGVILKSDDVVSAIQELIFEIKMNK